MRESVLQEQSLHGATLATPLEPPFTPISTPLAQPNRRCLLFPRVSCGAPFTRALPLNCAPSSLMSRWGFHKDSKPTLCRPHREESFRIFLAALSGSVSGLTRLAPPGPALVVAARLNTHLMCLVIPLWIWTFSSGRAIGSYFPRPSFSSRSALTTDAVECFETLNRRQLNVLCSFLR